MRRIAVVGPAGSGKTTLGRELADLLGVPFVELDALHHLPAWQPIATDEFRRIVSERAAAERWVIDGNYGSKVQDIVLASADTVVWLDLPRRTVMRSIIQRTLGRIMLGRELWNGNRERLRNLFDRRPEENIILWAWTSHSPLRERYEAVMRDPALDHLSFVRLRSRREMRRWLGSRVGASGEEQDLPSSPPRSRA